MWRATLAALTLLALGLRLHLLVAVPLRWDEGWSIAMATISWREMVRLTALDVHPPLYYALLAPWLRLAGTTEFGLRSLSALASTAAVPLAATTTALWWPASRPIGRTAGLIAALLLAVAPPLVYYAGVGRMYSLATLLLLATARCVGQLSREDGGGPRTLVPVGATAAAAVYTFYYCTFAVAGIWLAGFLRAPRLWRRLLVGGSLAVLAYGPWLAVATGPLTERTSGRLALFPGPATLAARLEDGFCGLVLCQAGSSPSRWLVGALWLAALLEGTRSLRALGLSLLPVSFVLLGASVGAEAHMLAARYVIVATPFLLLGLAWACAILWHRSPPAGVLAVGLLVLSSLPPLGGYVYARTAEVSGPYDPAAVWRQLQPQVHADDLVVFNILSLAGAYERYRRPQDPAWTYAQLWDPVHEAVGSAKARLASRAPERGRLWLVLYRGIASPDTGQLKAWADQEFYPAGGWWHEDIWYQSYVRAQANETWHGPIDFGHGVRLERAALTNCVVAGGGIGVELAWQATAIPDADGRVFVHAYDGAGRLVAQHDSYPASDTRPPPTWAVGEAILDRHGLWVPPNTEGDLVVVVGLYDPRTTHRWALADSRDSLPLARVTVLAADGHQDPRCP